MMFNVMTMVMMFMVMVIVMVMVFMLEMFFSNPIPYTQMGQPA